MKIHRNQGDKMAVENVLYLHRHALGLLLAVAVIVPACLPCPTDLCTCYNDKERFIVCTDFDLVRIPYFMQDNVTYDYIALSGNLFRRILSRAFRDLQVREILINDNKRAINIHPKAFRGTEQYLEHLMITGSREISSLPSGLFRKMRKLIEVNLSRNGIKNISVKTFYKAYSIEKLDLQENYIQSLQAGMFKHMRNLKTLLLKRNSISFVDSAAFSGLAGLQELYLDNNYIRDLQPMTFESLGKLTILDLSTNEIPALFPIMFKGMTTLEILNLQNNPLLFIFDDAFSDMGMLSVLDLSHTELGFLSSGMFQGLTKLTTLKLDKNKIDTLPDGVFQHLPALKELTLRSNKLKLINPCAFSGLSHIQKIDAFFNHVKCTCDMQWVMREDAPEIVGVCSYPSRVERKKIQEQENYRKCKDNKKIPLMCSHGNNIYETNEEMSNAVEMNRQG